MNNLFRVFAIAIIVTLSITFNSFSQNQEHITITTYYPSPNGSFDQMGANKLAVDVPGVATTAEYAAMQNGDMHIGRSLIVGPPGSVYDYTWLSRQVPDLRPTGGEVLISGNVSIGTTNPVSTRLTVVSHNFQRSADDPDWNTAPPNTAIRGISDTGFGVEGYSNDRSGVRGNSADSVGGVFIRHNGNPTGISPVLELYRSGNPVNNGIGASLDFYVENDWQERNPGTQDFASTGRVASALTNVAAGSESSYMSFWTRTDGTAAGFSEKMRIDGAGNVGIGTADPKVKLDLNSGGTIDGVRLGYVDETRNPNRAGTIRYLSNPAKMQYCDGSGWVDLGGGGSSGSAYCVLGSRKFSTGFRCSLGNFYISCEPSGMWKPSNDRNPRTDYTYCGNYLQKDD